MLEKIKKYKILIILSLAFLLSLISNTVYGFDFIDSEGKEHHILDLPSYVGEDYIIFKEPSFYFIAYPDGMDTKNENFVFRHHGTDVSFSYSLSVEEKYNGLSTCIWKPNEDKWKEGVSKWQSVINVDIDKSVLYSTRDIIECSTGEIYFSKNSTGGGNTGGGDIGGNTIGGNTVGGNSIEGNENSNNPPTGWFDNILSTLLDIPNQIKKMAESIGNFFGSFFENLWKTCQDLGNYIGNFFKDLGSSIGKSVESMWTNIS